MDDKLVKSIRDIYKQSDTAKRFFDHAAERQKDFAVTNVERISQIADVAYLEARRFAQSLEGAGCGEFITGRKGWKSRLKWRYSLRSLGLVAQGKSDQVQRIGPEVIPDDTDQQPIERFEAGVTGRLTIPEAKQRLGETLGISPEKIEIIVRA